MEGIRDVKAAVIYVNKMDTRVGEHVTLRDLKSTKDKTSFVMRKAKIPNIEHGDLHNFNREENIKEMFEEMVESHNIDDSVITGDDFDKHQCKERITCPDCYDIFHTPEDHRCAKPPAHVGKGKYMLLTGKYMLLTLLKSGKYML